MLKKLLTGAGILAISSLLSRVIGIFRTNAFAQIFGTGASVNAYFAGFAVTDFIYSLVIYAGVSAAFVPMFLELKNDERWRFVSVILNFVLITSCVFAGLLFLFAPQVVAVLYAGFDAETAEKATGILRILVLSPIIFGVSAVFMSVQTALGKFLAYSAGPLVYNGAILFGVWYFQDIYMVAWCAVFGALFHAFLQLSASVLLGYRYKMALFSGKKYIKEFVSLGIPRIFATMSGQINVLCEGIFASFVAFGSLSALRYAQDVQSFPLGIFGLSFATASFGALSLSALSGKKSEFTSALKKSLGKLWFFLLPSAVGIWLISEQIVKLIFGGGAFSASDSEIVAGCVRILAFGILFAGTVPLLSRAFYAQKNTRTPLYLALIFVVINVLLDAIFYRSWGVFGLCFGSAVANAVYAILLFGALARRFSLSEILPFRAFFASLSLSAVMGAVVLALQFSLNFGTGFFPNLLAIAVFAGTGGLVYLALAWLLGFKKLI